MQIHFPPLNSDIKPRAPLARTIFSPTTESPRKLAFVSIVRFCRRASAIERERKIVGGKMIISYF